MVRTNNTTNKAIPRVENTGSPEGNQTAEVGTYYTNTTTGDQWFKRLGAGNTGWIQVGSGTGVTPQGAVTADPAPAVGNTIYSLDGSGGAFDFTLPAATGSQDTIIVSAQDMTNAVTIKPQSGEALAGQTDGSYVVSNNGEQLHLIDRSTGNWDVALLGSPTQTGSLSRIHVELTSDTSVSNASPVPFNSELSKVGTAISNSNGVFTLEANKTYRLMSDTKVNQAAVGFLTQWRDITNATLIGNSTQSLSTNANVGAAQHSLTVAYLTTTTTTTVQVENTEGSSRTARSGSHAWIEEIPTNEYIPAGALLPAETDSWQRYLNADVSTSEFDTTGNDVSASILNTVGVAPRTSNIIDNADGTVTLKAGYKYEIEASMRPTLTSGTTDTVAVYYGINDGTSFLGALGTAKGHSDATSVWGNAYHETDVLSTDTTYRVRIETGDNTSGDCIRGSYFRVRMLPSKTAVPASDTETNDQTNSGFFDLGAMRMQFGTDTSTASVAKTITLPVAMANTNYTVVGNIDNNVAASRLVTFGNKTTTSFDVAIYQTNNFAIESYDFSYQVMGEKP